MFFLFASILAVQVAQAAPLFTRQALSPDLTVVKVSASSDLVGGVADGSSQLLLSSLNRHSILKRLKSLQPKISRQLDT